MTIRQAFGTTAALSLASIVAACGASKPATPTTTDLQQLAFEKYALPNGLEVILHEDRRLPLVAVDVWYHVGPANEAAGRTGFAHLFEHMMFQGSKHVPGDSHFRLLEAAGGTGLNGTTNLDRTNYFETLPANQLALGLWLESDRMGYLLDTVDELKLANQQAVVRSERSEGENSPYGIVEEAVAHQLFPKGHPYYANVIGSHADIQAANLADVKTFFKQYYAPNNASLAIAGDFDKAEAKRLIEKYFGPLKRGPDVPKVTVKTPPITAERRAVVTDRVELPRVYMAWITPAFFAQGDADADALANVLGGGNHSRLYKSLVYEKQLAQSVSATQQSAGISSVFQIVATARPGRSADEIAAAIDEELERFRQSGPDDREVEQARNSFETQLLQGLETLGGFGGVADTLNMFNHYVADPGYLPRYIAEHRQVSAGSVKAFAQAYLKKDARVVVYGVPGQPDFGPPVAAPPVPKVAPGTGAESVNADEAWRNSPPVPSAPLRVQIPPPATYTLPNGLTVLHQERQGMPVVSAALVVGTGGEANPVTKSGLASFAAELLDQGTTTRDATTIANDVAQIGASLSATTTKDATTVTVQSLASRFPAALDLLADVTLRPSFPQPEVERQRASRLGELAAQRQNPGTVAALAALTALYGPRHPYGYIELGTEAAANAITRDDLAGFWKSAFVPANAALIVSGTISPADLKPLVEKAFGGWAAGQTVPTTLGRPESSPSRLVIVDKPGAPQTYVMVATIGAPWSTPDLEAAEVMNAVLGGLFSSRINLNLRETHGYTYGAGSQFVFRKSAGPFWIQSAVATAATAPAVTEIFNEIKRIVAAPITPEELTMGRDAIVRQLPGTFETSSAAVGQLANIFVYKLGLDYYTKYAERVGAVTADAAQAAAKKYLAPERMVVVAVGDKAKIEAGLRKVVR